jgi:nitrite reductase/ring-hydroxylating ferredoxin subunit
MPALNESRASETGPAEVITQVPVPRPGGSARLPFRGTMVAVFNSEGRLYALEAECGHRKGPLEQGTILEGAVACPWHGARFDLDTGEVVGGNFFVRRSTRSIRTFQVRGIEGRIGLSERLDHTRLSSVPLSSKTVAAHVDPA